MNLDNFSVSELTEEETVNIEGGIIAFILGVCVGAAFGAAATVATYKLVKAML